MTAGPAGLLAAALLCACGLAHATDPQSSTASSPSTIGAPDALTWAALTPAQNAALAPLRSDWNALDARHQQKWLKLAEHMTAMPLAERQRIQQRMAQWSQLSPEKRSQARHRFLEARQLPAPQRQARWAEYQALSPEQKGLLAAQARAATAAERAPPVSAGTQPLASTEEKPSTLAVVPISRPKATTGAMVQAKPGATTRALTTPAAPPLHHQPGMPKISATEGFVDPATLLPKRGAQGAAVHSALTSDKPSGQRTAKP